MTIEIPLTQGQIALISDEDADLAQLKWCASLDPNYSNGGKYIARRKTVINGTRTTEQMHRVIMSRMLGRPLLRTEKVDHIHGLTLDNRRSELRLATDSQNGMNRGKQSNSTSGYKGVSWSKKSRKWLAHITVNRKAEHLGFFATPEEAYEAYKAAAVEKHGKFARFE